MTSKTPISPRQTIAIDIDDVIADSTEALRLLVNERTGATLTELQYRQSGEYWGYYERVWQTHGIADQVSYSDFEAEMLIDQSRVSLLPGAEFAIHELSERFRIVLITARHKEWEEATRRWLETHLANKDIELYFCESHRDAKAKTKGQICTQLGASWLIDDNIAHCKSALSEGIEAVLFGEYGWHTSVLDGAVRCKDWPEVLEYFDGKAAA